MPSSNPSFPSTKPSCVVRHGSKGEKMPWMQALASAHQPCSLPCQGGFALLALFGGMRRSIAHARQRLE